MSSDQATIVCGDCKCAVQTVPDPQPHDKVTCPRCDRWDSFENVMRSVGEHVEYETARFLQEQMAKAARGSRVLQFKPKPMANRSFRWMIEGGL